ncbi:FKBP-type peptidyl-prolyl cis-trans isomerase [Pseudactinotalea suaedae]|uniref:FKBP-type peptidyl-prolyl cis-trans isomerase n=1 Tax=Pseudactinotalea suaedae TaxID=1524924 RepID=UPI0012E2BA80|nr:FKBP-type peptidyl-prolyl cis-trans isomerase [Pseudactinotalea suaedae]
MPATLPRPALRALAALLALLVVVVLAGCRQDPPPEDPTDGVEVAGEVGRRPMVSLEVPLQITEVITRELVTGAGEALAEGDAVMLSYIAYDAITGEVVEDSYGAPPRILLLTEDEAGTLYEELLGRTEGTRLLRLEPGTMTVPDPVVIVYDILPTEAVGTPLEAPAALPQVATVDDGTPTITLPESSPPNSLTIAQLVRGEGPQVQAGESVTVRYVQMAWSTGEILESTWGPGSVPVTIPLVDRIPGLQDGLVDAAVGSRVLLVVPPAQADGTDTMVFVVDVLAVTSQAEATPEGSGS